MEITAIRPVVVYGPGVRGNIATLLKWASYGLPLPIRNIQNRRSLLGVGNLCDFLLRCAQAPALKRNAYLISDGADLSTPELYRKVAFALQRSARMFPAPLGLLAAARPLPGFGKLHQRIFDSFAVDPSNAMHDFDWAPPHSIDHGLATAAKWFLESRARPGS